MAHTHMFRIARSKLNHPRPTCDLVHRPRLVQRLDAGVAGPVTLISAPAGYGKTTLLAEWLQDNRRRRRRVAWYSLDEHDNQLIPFVAYLVAAIQTVFPGALPATTGMIGSSRSTSPSHLATALSNDIAELPADCVLVLDDYHLTKDAAVHELMGHLIRRLPAALHLVIAARTDLPLPLAQLHARGQLCELRAHDLRFTLEEVRAFLSHTLTGAAEGAFSEETLQAVEARMEGWPAGWRFASLALQEPANAQHVIEHLMTQTGARLMDYLLNEVLMQQSSSMQTFLLRTSILDEFTAGLCDAVMDEPQGEGGSSQSRLDELVRNDLLVRLDGEKAGWYRYHHLFGQFLRANAAAHSGSETMGVWRRRACGWCAQHGLVTEAIQHAIAAAALSGGDYDQAAQLVEEHVHEALNRESARPLLERWLGFFPPESLDERLELIVARLWLATLQDKVAAVPSLVARLEQLLAEATDLDPDKRRRAIAASACAQSALAVQSNDGARAIEIVSDFQSDVPVSHTFARGNMLAHQAVGYQMIGQTDAALQLLTDALQQETSSSPAFALRLMAGFAEIHLNNADLVSLVRVAETILRLATGPYHLSALWAHWALGLAQYEWNNLAEAAQHFAAAAELRDTGNIKVGFESIAWLALTQQAQGMTDAANATMEDLVRFADEARVGGLVYDKGGYRARLASMRGEAETALRWAQSVSFNPRPHLLFAIEAHLTRLRTLLASGKPEHLRTLLGEADALLEVAESTHNTRRVLQLYALKACALDGLGHAEEALDALQYSLTLAEPGGFIRTYVDLGHLGPGMARMLTRLRSRPGAPAGVKRILAAMPRAKAPLEASHPVMQAVRAPKPTPTPLIEPLTVRELQVLKQLGQRLTDKEIAHALVISPLTVKAHTDHIYRKLDVNSRQEAVQVALAYGILDRTSVSGAYA